MRNLSRKSIAFAFALIALLVAPSRSSGYQGFGASTPGGSGGTIIHVTNLNDSGPGSFRDAVSGGSRTVVFDVGGQIILSSDVDVKGSFVTIDGFTAPAPGITLKNYGLAIRRDNGAHDVIVRGIRVRDAAQDGIQVAAGAYNVVIDHVSVHNSGDGNIDVTQNGTRDVTVSWSIIAEPAGEEKNMLLAFGQTRATLHHNIFIDSAQRSPQVTYDDSSARTQDPNTTLDMRNNIIWNWQGGYGTRIRYGGHANVVNNFYSSDGGDPSKGLIVCKGLSSDSQCYDDVTNIARAYVNGNYSRDGINIDSEGTETTPFPAPTVDTQDALTAACQALSGAGVHPLDAIDQQYLSQISLTSCGSDPIAPSVVLSSPANGSTVWGTTTVSAIASDNVGVAGVQFQLDGVDLAPEDTTAPYSINWNTTGATNGSHNLTAAARDGAGNITISEPITVTVSNFTSANTKFLVNAGGGAYTDGGGNLWSADRAYSSGSWGYAGGVVESTGHPIANTNDDPLYRSGRTGTFNYRFDVPNGLYDVVLHFAEIYHNAAGKRTFDVLIEGALVLDNFDVYAAAGHDTAVTWTFQGVSVLDGQLTINFVTVKDKAKVSAIHIQSSASQPPVPNNPPLANAGPDQTVAVGDPVTFYGSASSDPDGDPLAYSWDLGDSTVGSGVTVTHTYSAAGTYSVTLTVSDGELSATDTALVTVNLSPPAPGPDLVIDILAPLSYQVAPLVEGDRYYIDRSYVLVDIPTAFEGLVWIKTANDDSKKTTENFLTFTVNRDVQVYVAYDRRAKSLPNWLRSFTPVGQAIAVSDSGATPLNLYTRTFSAGTITLGGNQAAGASGASSNYVVLIAPLE